MNMKLHVLLLMPSNANTAVHLWLRPMWMSAFPLFFPSLWMFLIDKNRALERKRVQIEKQRAESAQLQRALDVKESLLITGKLGAFSFVFVLSSFLRVADVSITQI